MPASPSSPISPALEQLAGLPAGDRKLLAGRCPALLEYPAWIPDPRDPRGVRHTLTSLSAAAVAAVLAGSPAQGSELAAVYRERDPRAERERPYARCRRSGSYRPPPP